MTAPIYEIDCANAPFTSLNTLQTVVGVKGAADFGLQLVGFSVGAAGVTASNPAGLVRPFSCTFATNPPGTASTSMTPNQSSGRTLASGMTAAYQWTTEPTVKTYIKGGFTLTPNGGTVIYDYPLGQEPDTPALSSGFGLEVTFSAAVLVWATLYVQRI